jgi:hypothetical protein
LDADRLKILMPILGGLLAFIGGSLTFFNGRLKDAEGEEGRARVYSSSVGWVAFGFTVIGIIAAALGAGPMIQAAFYSIAVGIITWAFCTSKSEMNRVEVATFVLTCVVFIGMISTAFTLNFIERLSAVMIGAEKTQGHK